MLDDICRVVQQENTQTELVDLGIGKPRRSVPRKTALNQDHLKRIGYDSINKQFAQPQPNQT
jgi:hypothetical protein